MGSARAIAGNRRVELFHGSAAKVAERVADRYWHRYSGDAGAKGPRFSPWAWACIDAGRRDRRDPRPDWRRRRQATATTGADPNHDREMSLEYWLPFTSSAITGDMDPSACRAPARAYSNVLKLEPDTVDSP